ncbi:MAG: TIGR03905 family TSCPD domain-containing protein [Lachnospiraceae bacterium]|jgi:uncharacterized protein (TIGR03905 family)|nr:TIGR03905 family TSCPD domain-containing protein [Lachnospiraceae bacterium]
MHYTYQTKNTCSSQINFDLEDGIVSNVSFTGGCNGNLKAIPALIEGWPARDVVAKLRNITCGRRPTSCADQLAQALHNAISSAE